MIDYFINLLEQWAGFMPLPWFTFVGALVEEILAPIPSPFVMTLAGSLAASQNQPVAYLALLAVTGMVGKMIGCYIIYWLALKFEFIVTTRFGKALGISHNQIERLSKRLSRGKGDNITMFLLRAIPIVPTAPISFAAGLLRLELKMYLLMSALGILVRNIFYLYLGFTSVGALENLNDNIDSVESLGSIFTLVAIGGLFLFIYTKRRQL